MKYNKTYGRKRKVTLNLRSEMWFKIKDFCEKEGISPSMFIDDLFARFFMDNREWLAYKYRESATQADFYRSRIAQLNIKQQEKEMVDNEEI